MFLIIIESLLEDQALVSLKLFLVLLNIFSIIQRLKYSVAMVPGLIVMGKVVTKREVFWFRITVISSTLNLIPLSL